MGTSNWGTNMTKLLRRLAADIGGATAVEYGLIVTLICIACIGAVTGVANKTIKLWDNVSEVANRS
jgi:pilus assembly protein Flp/PilA